MDHFSQNLFCAHSRTGAAYCDARRLAVVPQGGKTGLVGGSVPVHDEVVLSTTGLDSIEAFDEDTGVVTCGAGVVLAPTCINATAR